MSQAKLSVEQDARARAAQTLADGKPIMDKALLIRCAEQIEHLKRALDEIIDNAARSGGIWARQTAERALERDG